MNQHRFSFTYLQNRRLSLTARSERNAVLRGPLSAQSHSILLFFSFFCSSLLPFSLVTERQSSTCIIHPLLPLWSFSGLQLPLICTTWSAQYASTRAFHNAMADIHSPWLSSSLICTSTTSRGLSQCGMRQESLGSPIQPLSVANMLLKGNTGTGEECLRPSPASLCPAAAPCNAVPHWSWGGSFALNSLPDFSCALPFFNMYEFVASIIVWSEVLEINLHVKYHLPLIVLNLQGAIFAWCTFTLQDE